MPYIGLTGNYRYDSFEFGGSFKYSGWVKASDNDEHYNPEKRITYRSDVNNQNYYSVSLHAGYYITPAAKVYVDNTVSLCMKSGRAASLKIQELTETLLSLSTYTLHIL
uniref:Protease VII (Omptin) n=1 Tax=Escherichia coli TaxID=562 RepID=A0A890DG59_ECOLX|nr:Protease VII (Omptin) precursor [Escherichia coli]